MNEKLILEALRISLVLQGVRDEQYNNILGRIKETINPPTNKLAEERKDILDKIKEGKS